MRQDKQVADWRRIYDSLTNPDRIAENKRKAEREKRSEDKKKDVGL